MNTKAKFQFPQIIFLSVNSSVCVMRSSFQFRRDPGSAILTCGDTCCFLKFLNSFIIITHNNQIMLQFIFKLFM